MRVLLSLLFISSVLYGGSVPALQDPTRPSNYSIESGNIGTGNQAEGLSLDAIFVSEARRIAIINGVPVSVGQEQFGAKLIAINSDNIIVQEVIDGISQQRTIGVNSTGEVKKNATNNF